MSQGYTEGYRKGIQRVSEGLLLLAIKKFTL